MWSAVAKNLDNNSTVSYLTAADQLYIGQLFCNSSIFVGDMLNSGSTLDVSFWFTHPTVERMWQRKALSGSLWNLTWTKTEHICPGHSPNYIMPFFSYNFIDNTIDTSDLTNEQFTALINPSNDDYSLAIPYVYADFNYSSCEQYGDDDRGSLAADLIYDAP